MKVLKLLLLTLLVLAGCTLSRQKLEFQKAKRLAKGKEYQASVLSFAKAIEMDPNTKLALNAAQSGSVVAAELAKDYDAAIRFYRHIVFKTDSESERISAKKSMAQIFFEQLKDYNQAVLEYESLLGTKLPEQEAYHFRLNVIKSQLELNNLEQALADLEALLSLHPKGAELYEAKVLKSNIYISKKKFQEASTTLKEVIKEFPERAQKENLHLALVSCYEDLEDFTSAVAVLESMTAWYSHRDFLELRIKRLKERTSNQPGAQGWKK